MDHRTDILKKLTKICRNWMESHLKRSAFAETLEFGKIKLSERTLTNSGTRKIRFSKIKKIDLLALAAIKLKTSG